MQEDAWVSALYDQYYAVLRATGKLFLGSHASGEDVVEDMIHDVFVLLWKKRNSLVHHPNIGGWLVEAMRRTMLAHMKRLGRWNKRKAFSLDAVTEHGERTEIPSNTPSVESIVSDQERRELLGQLLGKENADIFYRFCVEGVPSKELAAQYGLSDGSIRMRISRMKTQILANRELFFTFFFLLVLHSKAFRP